MSGRAKPPMYVARKTVLPNGKKSVKVYTAVYKQKYGSRDDIKGYKITVKGKLTPVKPRTVAFFDKKEALEYAALMRRSDKRGTYSMFDTKRISSRKRPKRTASAYIKYMKANLGNMKGMSLEESSQHLKKVGLGWKKLTAAERKEYS